MSENPVSRHDDRELPVTVAVVEDNPEIVNLYVQLIESWGMRVCFVAGNGDEAVKAYNDAETKPDVLLVDHRMPLKSGLDAMKDILALDRGARFIFISADEGIRGEAMAAGAKAFLRKPAMVREIYGAIERVLEAKIE